MSLLSTSADHTHTLTPEKDGPLHVTRRCFGIGICRNVAPELFGEVPAESGTTGAGASGRPGSYEAGAFTGVLRQPQDDDDFTDAREAARLCPNGAIRVAPFARSTLTSERRSAPRPWPQRLEDNVWAVGHPSPKNFGAMPYFVELPGGGILVDLPQPSDALFEWLDVHGGVRWIFITHRDHASHHRAFAERFPDCRRVIGADDVVMRETKYRAGTMDVEVKLDSRTVVSLDGTPIPVDELDHAECAVITQPGHTPGSLCLLYRDRFLFSGDHLHYSRLQGAVVAARLVCWEDWERQTDSVRTLARLAEAGRLRFDWLLAGHGEWHHFTPDGGGALAALKETVEWMGQQPPGRTSLVNWVLFVFMRTKPRSRLVRVLRLIGGESDDTWVLPHAVRHYVPDHDPTAAHAAIRRAYAIGAVALAGLVLLVQGLL